MPNVTVNRHARIRRAIVDREVVVPRGAIIGYDPAEDRRRHTVSDGGVVVVTPGEECLVDPAFDRDFHDPSLAPARLHSHISKGTRP